MKKLIAKIKSWFSSSFKYLKSNSELAVKVTGKLKDYVESPMADIVVNLIPGGLDNAGLILLRKHIPVVAVKMALAHNILQESKAPSEAIDKIVAYLKSLKIEARAAFWVQFAGELNLALSDGKISFAEAVILSQMSYVEFYENDNQKVN